MAVKSGKVFDSFDPTDPVQVANLNRPRDNVNSAKASRYIHPEDPLFGLNGFVFLASLDDRQQQKNMGGIRKFADIQSQVHAFVGQYTKHRSTTLFNLRERKKALIDQGADKDEIAQLDKKIEALSIRPIIAFSVRCKGLFANEQMADSPGANPVAIQAEVFIQPFESKEAVTTMNKQIADEPCRNYGTAETRYYKPFWVIA